MHILYGKGVHFMATTNLNIRTDAEIKAAAEQLFNELGMNLTTAVNLFLRQAIRTGGIPFEIKINAPGEITAAAIAEGRKLLHDPSVQGYRSMEDLKAALDS